MKLGGNKAFFRPLILLIIVVIPVGCSKIAAVNESLDWQPLENFVSVLKTGTGWKGIKGDETFRIVYVRSTETSSTWSVKAETLQLPIALTSTGAFHWNPKSVMDWLKKGAENQQCSTEHWTVLEQNGASLLFEWDGISCSSWPTQHEIGRIVIGQWYLWVISYGTRNSNAPVIERDALIANLKSAKVGTKASTR